MVCERGTIIEDVLHSFPDTTVITVSPEGEFNYLDGTEVRIKYCERCQKFFFSKKLPREEDLCPDCHSPQLKHLSNNNRIPGWFGTGKHYIIDEQAARAHLELIDEENRSNVENVIKLLSGEPRFIRLDDDMLEQIKKLKNKYPNMSAVIEYIIEAAMASAMRNSKGFTIKPILLVGGPGCGKTAFASELTRIIMGKAGFKVDLGNDVAIFTITGSDPTFRKGRCGIISESMFSDDGLHPLANPIIHFDELDKISDEREYNCQTVFYALLEKSTSRCFFENFVGVNIDASNINYIFTSNTLENIPAPILNRLTIFQIQDYTHEQLRDCVIDYFYENWLEINDMARQFLPAVLSDEIKEQILQECHDDTRSIEVAIYSVFYRTQTLDSETKHPIALFSEKELCAGWKNFRGHRKISKEQWTLPDNFLRNRKQEKNFNLAEYLETY